MHFQTEVHLFIVFTNKKWYSNFNANAIKHAKRHGKLLMETGMEKSRNEQIIEVLGEGQSPLLTFELAGAHEAFKKHVERQREHGAQLGVAMTESSETSHDNGPADAIVNDATVNALQATKVIKRMKNAYEFEMPTRSDAERVTLGSVVDLKFQDSQNPEKYFLTGATARMSDIEYSLLGLDDDTATVTLSSPLGKAFFDRSIGDEIEYNVGSKTVKATIIAIA